MRILLRLWPIAFSILSSTAHGQFAPAVQLSSNSGDPPLRAVDVDGDTDADLLGLFDSKHFRWFANTDGNGDFSIALNVVSTSQPIGRWTTGDLNNDALPDIVFLDGLETSVWWFENLGDAQFAVPAWIGDLPATPAAMQLADITGEGFPDVVLFIDDGSGGNIFWFPNTAGMCEPLAQAELSIPGAALSFLLAGDMDFTGGIDLIVSNWNQVVFALRNLAGDASIWQVDTLISGSSFAYESASSLIDVDNDGDLDLAEAGAISLHWAENHIGEGGAWSAFTDHELEPWTSAGIGTFAHLGCNEATGVVYMPSNPGLPMRWTAWTNDLNTFAYRADLASIPRGTGLLVADFTGDDQADVVITTDAGTAWYRNVLTPATTVLDLPVLSPLCMYGEPYQLPDVLPTGGRWSGFNVDQNILYRTNLQGTGTYPLTHVLYEPEGCPVGTATSIFVVTEPVIGPNTNGVICSADAPIQFTSSPPATTWVGLSPDGILDPATYDNGVFVAIYEDMTGTTCSAESQPIEVWTSLSAEIIPVGPYCITAGPQLVQAASAPPFGVSWSGDIESWNSSGATFLPSQGAGTYTVVLNAEVTSPNQCPGTDTLLITVSDDFPEVLVDPLGPQCANGTTIELEAHATPTGGIWSGPGLSGSTLDPQAIGAGNYLLTYTYFDPAGCAASGALGVDLYDNASLSWAVEDLILCSSDPEVQLTAQPAGGTWSSPVDGNGVVQPASLAQGSYPLTYTWTGPNGCTLVNDANTIERWNTTAPMIDPLGEVCDDDPAFPITGSPAGTWSGAVDGEGSFVLFDPTAKGVGTWPVTLTAANPGECPGSVTVDVVVELCTGMEETAASGFSVAPNPFTDAVTLDLGSEPARMIDVLDAVGRLVFSTSLPSAGRTTLDLHDALPGAYLLHVWTTDGSLRTARLAKL